MTRFDFSASKLTNSFRFCAGRRTSSSVRSHGYNAPTATNKYPPGLKNAQKGRSRKFMYFSLRVNVWINTRTTRFEFRWYETLGSIQRLNRYASSLQFTPSDILDILSKATCTHIAKYKCPQIFFPTLSMHVPVSIVCTHTTCADTAYPPGFDRGRAG